jgi:glycosyltransferase involved in cell wall biosynthesis
VSGFSKRYVEDWICKNKSVDVIYNPIEDALFENVMESGDTDTILFFGKVVETKGAFNLIRAFNVVAKRYPQARLKVVGNGDMEVARGLVDAHCADRVSFVEFMPKEQVMSEIDDASFCVLPSYFENFSMAALEVLARKRALIYTNRASGSELIEDGENGLLVNPDDVMQIADKMELLLCDTTLRDRLAEKGYEMCRRRFSTDVIIPQMESYYKEIIVRCRK